MTIRNCAPFVTAVLLMFPLCGCGGPSRYVPTATSARQALETALSTWQSGQPHGPIEASKPAIHVFDSRWQSGKKLQSFEILEEIEGQEHPQFQVRLQLAGQPEESLTYHVIGIDPLNVFRDADLQRAASM
jgi:hypothetical protein